MKDLAGKSFLELEESFGDVFEDAKCIGQKVRSKSGLMQYCYVSRNQILTYLKSPFTTGRFQGKDAMSTG